MVEQLLDAPVCVIVLYVDISGKAVSAAVFLQHYWLLFTGKSVSVVVANSCDHFRAKC